MSDSEEEEEALLSDVEEDEEIDKAEEDQEEVFPLTNEIISQGLSLLGWTANRSGHAYIKLDLVDNGLTDISAVSNYVHIRFLDVSNNLLTDLSPLVSLTHLLWLKADNNAVSCFKGQPFPQMKHLQWLSVAVNRLKDVEDFTAPALETLILSGNSIQDLSGFQGSSFSNLVTLELRGNLLSSTAGINLPKLKRLYLGQNGIRNLEGLETLENLKILHLRTNQLETLDGLNQNMKRLQYLNVRGNLILSDTALQGLTAVSGTLQALVLSENQLVDLPDYRLNVLTILPRLQRLDKEQVSSEEREEALQKIGEHKEQEMLSENLTDAPDEEEMD